MTSVVGGRSVISLESAQLAACSDLIDVEIEIREIVEEVNAMKVTLNDNWVQQHLSNMQLQQQQQQTVNLYPKFIKGVNYYQEFWRTYLMNEMMISKIKEFSEEAKLLDVKITDLDSLHREYQKLIAMKNKKKNRRTANEIEKRHTCQYEDCRKVYGSEVSLNLHIKLKHNGGNKTEREKLARSIFLAQETGTLQPDLCLSFPPGYLELLKEQYEQEKALKLENAEEGGEAKEEGGAVEKEAEEVGLEEGESNNDQETLKKESAFRESSPSPPPASKVLSTKKKQQATVESNSEVRRNSARLQKRSHKDVPAVEALNDFNNHSTKTTTAIGC